MNRISPKRLPVARTPGRRPRRRWLAAVSLAACLAAAYPAAAAVGGTAASAGTGLVNCGPGPRPPCYSPKAYETAYGVAPLLRRAEASGGGYSSLFPRPPYQHGLARARATRGVPDVSANAEPATAMATDNSYGQLRRTPVPALPPHCGRA